MAPTRDPFLLIVRSGPIWNLEKGLRFIAGAFSPHYDGEIVTRSSSHRSLSMGRFRVRSFRYRGAWIPAVVHRLAYTLSVILSGMWIRWVRGRHLVVITYDPFQSGGIGLALRWLADARFICEVNGLYGHPDTYIDLDPSGARAKLARMVRVGSFVLRRAHFIKLLYPEQLVGFSVPSDVPPRASFHNPIDEVNFEPTGHPPTRRLIFVGHPYNLKGVDLLLKAFGRVASDFPEWRLLLVGWRIEESAREAEFPRERVDFLGPQPPEALRELMEGSSGLVLPSRSEGMGRVLLEAAFLGRPRIGSRAGGIPYLIHDGVDGLLFATGDVDGLEQALRRFLGASDSDRLEMGRAARERARRDFTTHDYIRQYRSVIDSLLGGHDQR
jgi:glycosyltransferase involved in cell wall biosynthesis